MFVLGNLLACIFWGIIIALGVTAIVFVLGAVFTGGRLSPLAYAVLLVLFVLAAVQGTLLSGGLYTKGYVDDVEEIITPLIPDLSETNLQAVAASYDEVQNAIIDEYPMLLPLLSQIDLSQLSSYLPQGGGAVATYVGNQLRALVTDYVLRRVYWLLGFMLLATLAVVLLGRRHDRADSVSGYDSSTWAYDGESTSYGGADDY